MRKPWWRQKKVWGVVIGALLRLFGSKMGLDPEAAEGASNCILAGVGVEGLADALGAFRKRD